MLTLAKIHSFDADPEKCSLGAGYGYAGKCFSWGLGLQSKHKRLHLGDEAEGVFFAISLDLPLGATDWRRLGESRIELPPECLAGSFYFQSGWYGEREDSLSLDLRFGESRGGRVEVWANGIGSVEAAPDIFPDGQVEFEIHTWAAFRGVCINVPLNVSDPIAYSERRVRSLLPHYAFSPPVERKTKDDDGVVRVVEVTFAPNESSN